MLAFVGEMNAGCHIVVMCFNALLVIFEEDCMKLKSKQQAKTSRLIAIVIKHM